MGAVKGRVRTTRQGTGSGPALKKRPDSPRCCTSLSPSGCYCSGKSPPLSSAEGSGMARVGTYDQENVDRFVKRGLYRFRWVPAWESWFERRGGVWRSEGAEGALKAAYY